MSILKTPKNHINTVIIFIPPITLQKTSSVGVSLFAERYTSERMMKLALNSSVFLSFLRFLNAEDYISYAGAMFEDDTDELIIQAGNLD